MSDPTDEIRRLINEGAPDVLARIAEVLGYSEKAMTTQPQAVEADESRAEFEAWMNKEHPRSSMGDHVWNSHARNSDGSYVVNFTSGAWDGWQANEARLQACQTERDAQFKNFHRALCERFGYVHDPIDWKRDLVSLEEHIAARIRSARVDALEKLALDKRSVLICHNDLTELIRMARGVPGWKLVPVEPTEDMLEASVLNHSERPYQGRDGFKKTYRKIYGRMLAAAPTTPPEVQHHMFDHHYDQLMQELAKILHSNLEIKEKLMTIEDDLAAITQNLTDSQALTQQLVTLVQNLQATDANLQAQLTAATSGVSADVQASIANILTQSAAEKAALVAALPAVAPASAASAPAAS